MDPATGRAVQRRVSRDERNFPGCRLLALGALGVLTRVRFRLVDERYFSVVQKIVALDDVLVDLEATSAKYDFWRVNWAPRSEKALLWRPRQFRASSRERMATTPRIGPSTCSTSS